MGIPLGDCTLITSQPAALQTGYQLGMKTCFVKRQEESSPLVYIDIETHSNSIVSSLEEAMEVVNKRTTRCETSRAASSTNNQWGF